MVVVFLILSLIIGVAA
ncbi:Protein of unknown function [Bacillus mycoides]|nr:Protein of unknown function [Bacillus mycoides]